MAPAARSTPCRARPKQNRLALKYGCNTANKGAMTVVEASDTASIVRDDGVCLQYDALHFQWPLPVKDR
jgi:hypothetical protein